MTGFKACIELSQHGIGVRLRVTSQRRDAFISFECFDKSHNI